MPRPKKSNRSDGRYEIKRTIAVDANGNSIRRSFYGNDKAEAEKAYHDFVAEREAAEKKKKNMPFAEWVDKWLYTYKEPDVKATTFLTTYERPCRRYILPHFKDTFLQDITQAHVKSFVNTISDLSQSMLDKILICLHGIFETAIDNDMIAKNPCRNVNARSKSKPKGKRTYDRETVEVICSSDHPYAVYPHILLRMGLRCSEMCGLEWKDIDLERGVLQVRQALVTEGSHRILGDPKSANSIRKLQIPEDLLDRLRAEREMHPGTTFVAEVRGRQLTPNHFGDRQLLTFYRAIGVPRDQMLSPHELRHTCGTLLYQETKDIYHVSRFLGHSDVGITTKIYVHSDMQEEPIHIVFSQ
jgi:integrase